MLASMTATFPPRKFALWFLAQAVMQPYNRGQEKHAPDRGYGTAGPAPRRNR